MTYQDEYEVARLHADAAFTQALEAQFDGPYRLAFHLAPPLLSPRDPNTGRPRKRRFGAWIRPVFGGLQHLRKLRGTPFDPFGHTTERKRERALISEYRELVSWSLPQVHAGNVEETIALLGAADAIRGFGPVKEEAMERYRSALPALRARLQAEVAVQAVRITP
jgi:indolepyruvate ferredoxin oxidoreductase